MDGLILIDKPRDITSFVAVAVVRRAMGEKKCGHTGTLDPLAEGLLPILTGKATKLACFFSEGDKAYRGKLTFGSATDSYDSTGTVTESGGRIPSLSEIETVLPEFLGKQLQTPPMYSAIKQNGVALYKLARQGQSTAIPPREITIYDITPVEYTDGVLIFDVHCSKGTYIRSLCVDLAERLGTYGHMSALTRTKTLGFSIEQAMPLYQAEQRLKAGDTSMVLSPEQALPFGSYTPPDFFATLLSNGCAVATHKLKNCPKGPVWVKKGDSLLGIGQILEDDTFKITIHM